MPHTRKRKLRTGTYWYVVDDTEHEHPCGEGKDGKEFAEEWVRRIKRLKYQRRAGFETERECVWTLADLREADLTDARRRGLGTAAKPRQGKKPYREWHWDTLTAFFGADTWLDAIAQDRILAFIADRERTVSPATINRDLDVLRSALRLARNTEASGYTGDPFRRIRKLKERHAEPITLTEKQLATVIEACWKRHPALGAHVELLAATCSRLNEEPDLERGFMVFRPQKRGRARSFRATPRMRYLLGRRRRFDYRIWKEVVRGLGLPELRPHHIRHSALTLAAAQPGASLLAIQARGGWKSPEMASRYLHADREVLEPAKRAKRR